MKINMLIDTHAHLNFNVFENDRDEVIRKSLAENVWIINIGTNYETSKKAVEIAEKYHQGVYAAIGLHPINIIIQNAKVKSQNSKLQLKTQNLEDTLEKEFDYEKHKELAKSEKVVAIGEIGLDYYYKPKIPTAKSRQSRGFSTKSEPSRILDADTVGIGTKKKLEEFKNKQKEIFLEQLELAKELNLPIIFHCRLAHDDLFNILKSEILNLKSEIKGVVHCFTGNWEQAKKYLEMGFYLGFNGIIFKLKLDEIIKKTPLEKILIETDCPYLAPPNISENQHLNQQKSAGARNEPLFVKYIAERIAEIKGVSFEKIAQITTQNAKELFGI